MENQRRTYGLNFEDISVWVYSCSLPAPQEANLSRNFKSSCQWLECWTKDSHPHTCIGALTI